MTRFKIFNGPEPRRRPGRGAPTFVDGRSDWYRMRNSVTNSTVADVWIYDEIGYWGVTAADFVTDLKALGNVKTLNVFINSPGGEVFDGIAIYNAIRNHPATVNVSIDGLAASAASFIAMAGDKITMGRGSTMMIHDASGICVGNAVDMRGLADMLDQISETIAGFYLDRAGKTLTHWRDLMRATTYFTADEAVTAGLAHEALAMERDRPDDVPANTWDIKAMFPTQPAPEPAPIPPTDPVPPVEPEPDPLVDWSAMFSGTRADLGPRPILPFDPDVFKAAVRSVATDAADPYPEPEPPAPIPTSYAINPLDMERFVREARA